MLARTLLRIWTQRTVWFFVGAAVTLLFTYLPAGFSGYTTAQFLQEVPSRPVKNVYEPQRIVPHDSYGPHKLGDWLPFPGS